VVFIGNTSIRTQDRRAFKGFGQRIEVYGTPSDHTENKAEVLARESLKLQIRVSSKAVIA
jgi:hypothetical protein